MTLKSTQIKRIFNQATEQLIPTVPKTLKANSNIFLVLQTEIAKQLG
jgi:hypothetical protein